MGTSVSETRACQRTDPNLQWSREAQEPWHLLHVRSFKVNGTFGSQNTIRPVKIRNTAMKMQSARNTQRE